MNSGIYKSKSEIRRLFSGNAISIDGVKVTKVDEALEVVEGSILKIGKGKFFKIQIKEYK